MDTHHNLAAIQQVFSEMPTPRPNSLLLVSITAIFGYMNHMTADGVCALISASTGACAIISYFARFGKWVSIKYNSYKSKK